MFVFDIDGTICFDGVTISPELRDSIERVMDEHLVVFATARHPVDGQRVLSPRMIRECLIIGGNGAVALQDTRVMRAVPLASGVWPEAVSFLEQISCPYIAYGDLFYFKSSAGHPVHLEVTPWRVLREIRNLSRADGDIIKVLVLPESDEQRKLVIERYGQSSELYIQHHRNGTLDFIAPGVNKHSMLISIMEPTKRYVAFGNDFNDVPLFINGSFSILVGGNDSLVAYVDEIVKVNPPAYTGIAEAIARYSTLLKAEVGN